jgi:hypothetical protein
MNIDLSLLRSLVTLVSFLVFVVLVWRTWQRNALRSHELASALPFIEDEPGSAP